MSSVTNADFEASFQMTLGNSNIYAIQSLKKINANRKSLIEKVLRGLVTKEDINNQIISELFVFKRCMEKINIKIKKKESYKAISDLLPGLAMRINSMWSDMYLLCKVDDKFVPTYINSGPNNNFLFMGESTSRPNTNTVIQSITSSVDNWKMDNNIKVYFSSFDFAKVLTATTFIDKTLLIKEVFSSEILRGTLITAPRKYGKSTSLSMLKYFLEIQVDLWGKPLTKAKDNEAIVDTNNYKLFKGLKIMNCKDIMAQHFGKHPVLFVNFQGANVRSMRKAFLFCRDVVHRAYMEHRYLKNNKSLTLSEISTVNLWCDSRSYKRIICCSIVANGLRVLAECLLKHFARPCFVLVDGHDNVIFPTYISYQWCKEAKQINDLVMIMLAFVKEENLVDRAFFAAKSEMATSGLLPSNIRHCLFFKFHQYTDYYGLIPSEIDYLFNKPEFKHLLPRKREVQLYYGGYNKVDFTARKGQKIYCMWSIMSFLKRNILDNYWKEVGNIFYVLKCKTIGENMNRLLQGNSFYIDHYNVHYKFYNTNLFEKPEDPRSVSYFFNFLLDVGYLTHDIQPVNLPRENNNENPNIVWVKIPNLAIKRDIENKIKIFKNN